LALEDFRSIFSFAEVAFAALCAMSDAPCADKPLEAIEGRQRYCGVELITDLAKGLGRVEETRAIDRRIIDPSSPTRQR